MSTSAPNGLVRFGVFEADLRSGELRKQGIKVKLPNQPFQILAMLLERPGEVITREQLHQRLWSADTFVDFEVGLNQAVKKLRDALGDSAESPRFIETLPRRGYRFVAPVESITPALPTASPPWKLSQRQIAAGVVAVVLLLGGLAGHILWQRNAGTGNQARVMMAVLPFENLTGDPAQEYLADGFTEEMIALLGQHQPDQLGVIARTSAMRYKAPGKSAAEIGHELNVNYLLEGSVRRDGESIRITAKLIRVNDQSQVWAGSYNRELRYVLNLQNEVAGDIARAIKVTLTPRQSSPARASREIDPQAYDDYLRGLYRWQRRGKEDLEAAIGYFDKAVQRDSSFAMAYACLARAQAAYYGLGYVATAEGVEKSEASAKRALTLNPFLGEAEVVLAWAHVTRWQWADAEKEFLRALELSPNDPIAHLWYGNFLLRLGRMEESLRHRQRAYELDPLDSVVSASLARSLFEVGREAEAFEQMRKTMELHPKNSGLHSARGSFYFRRKDYAAAKRDLEEAVRLCDRCPDALVRLGHVAAVAGDRMQAEEILKEVKGKAARQFVSPYSLATLYAGLGDANQAFAWLEKAFEARAFQILSLREDPYFMSLRGDARFGELLRRMNFPPVAA